MQRSRSPDSMPLHTVHALITARASPGRGHSLMLANQHPGPARPTREVSTSDPSVRTTGRRDGLPELGVQSRPSRCSA